MASMRAFTTGASCSVDTADNQSRIFEHLEVLRDGWLRNFERVRQFVDSGLPFGKAREDRSPRGVGQGRESGVEILPSIHKC
jgi:hypothetical protein